MARRRRRARLASCHVAGRSSGALDRNPRRKLDRHAPGVAWRGASRALVSPPSRSPRDRGPPGSPSSPRVRDRCRRCMADRVAVAFSAAADRAHPRLPFFHLRVFGDGAKLWNRRAHPVRAGDRLSEMSWTRRRVRRAAVSAGELQRDRHYPGGRLPALLVRRDSRRDRPSLVPGDGQFCSERGNRNGGRRALLRDGLPHRPRRRRGGRASGRCGGGRHPRRNRQSRAGLRSTAREQGPAGRSCRSLVARSHRLRRTAAHRRNIRAH